MDLDPVSTNPDAYRVLFENERVRVLEYTDTPGHRTTPHRHPDSVMVSLSSFRRRLGAHGREGEIAIAEAGATGVTVLPLHLRPGAREWFTAWLAREHPALVPRYRALYGRGA